MKKSRTLFISIALFLLMVTVLFASELTLWTIQPGMGDISQVAMKHEYCTDYMGYLRFYCRSSEMTMNFELPEDTYTGYRLRVTDAGSTIPMEVAKNEKPRGVWSALTIRVNDAPVAENLGIQGTVEETRMYDVGRYLRKGSNTIIFSLGPTSQTRYDLKSVSLIKS